MSARIPVAQAGRAQFSSAPSPRACASADAGSPAADRQDMARRRRIERFLCIRDGRRRHGRPARKTPSNISPIEGACSLSRNIRAILRGSGRERVRSCPTPPVRGRSRHCHAHRGFAMNSEYDRRWSETGSLREALEINGWIVAVEPGGGIRGFRRVRACPSPFASPAWSRKARASMSPRPVAPSTWR